MLVEQSEFQIKPLNSSHEKALFSCGVEALDNYFFQQAGQDMRRNIAVTYALTPVASERVIGYYSLSATSIELTNLPEAFVKKLPRYPTLPATLLGRLAVDKTFQKKGIGGLLLTNALKRSLINAEKIGSVAVVVDAKDADAAAYYRSYGFIPFNKLENKLYLPMRSIQATGLLSPA